MNKEQLSKMIDHTLLKPNVTSDEMKKHCEEALKYNFAMVAVNQSQVKFCSDVLKDTNVGIGAAISFPLGQTTIESKLYEIRNSIDLGATEIDYVINISALKNKDYDYIKEEMKQIVQLTKQSNVICKVIFETCLLTQNEIIKLCQIASEVKPNYVKTSTGFSFGGATIQDVKIMKAHLTEDIKVKASGGIRTLEDVKNFIALGIDRIGTSSGVKIINSLSNVNNN